uniref:transmembrane protein 217-like n=1 Tax=Pristiophorus japonicus TaxID=55135 RepID=UPI00398EC5F4
MPIIRKLRAKLRKLPGGKLCGLNAKDGTILAGLFMLMISIMHIIFEVGHLMRFQLIIASNSTIGEMHSFNVEKYCITSITFVSMTMIAVFLLFISVWKEFVWGVGGYIVWIIVFEVTQIFILSFSVPYPYEPLRSMRALELFGLIMRLISHVFWMIFVSSHTIELSKISKTTSEQKKSKQPMPPKLKFAKDMAV